MGVAEAHAGELGVGRGARGLVRRERQVATARVARYARAAVTVCDAAATCFLAALFALACACNQDAPAESSFGVGPTMAEPASSSSSSTSSAASSGSSSSSSTSDTSSTSGDASGTSTGDPPPDFGPPGPEGCRGKVDFLFVISASGTMAPIQQQILTLFPTFYSALSSEFADFDVHIMVVEPDHSWNMGDCSLCGEGCDPDGMLPTCGAQLDACDSTIGAGVTFPAGKDSSAQRCSVANGRYITREDPDPFAAFDCIARVGSGGGVALVADAMVAAVSPPLLGINGYPPGCNQGFLRDDALLVVTIITTNGDSESNGPAQAWVDALTAAKHGEGDAYQVLVITTDVDTPQHLCGEYSPDINRLRTFVELLPEGHGLIESVCADSYEPFFVAAVDAVLERCDAYVPQ